MDEATSCSWEGSCRAGADVGGWTFGTVACSWLVTLPLHHHGPTHPLPHLCVPGALGYVPLCFVLPCVMWLKTQRGSLSLAEQAANWLVICVSVLVGCLAAIGSLRSLIVSFSSYEFFS